MPHIITGNWMDTQKASLLPDASHVAVYLLVDENFKYSAEELIPPIKSYFDHYRLPVIFIKQANPGNDDMCSLRIYVGGDSISGDLSNGNFSLLRLEYDYKIMNHDSSLTQNFGRTLLIPLQVIETHIISFFSIHSYGYAFQKEFRSVFQALTNHFNIRS